MMRKNKELKELKDIKGKTRLKTAGPGEVTIC